MASKVNTRFVMVLAAALLGSGVIVAGLYVLSMRGDARRNIRMADEAFAAGDYKTARGYYGRAVNKQPSNAEYVQKLEKALLMITPVSKNEADELYRDRINILKHVIRHRSSDPQAHFRLIEELHFAARHVNQPSWWEALSVAADEMLQQVPPTDPAVGVAKAYRARAMFMLWTIRSEPERARALQDIEEAIVQAPNDDIVWSTMVTGQLSVLEKMRNDGVGETAIRQQQELVDRSLRNALAACPQGPETAKAELLCKALNAVRNPGDTSKAEMDIAAARMASLLTLEMNSAFLMEALSTLAMVSNKSYQRTIEFAKRYVEAHPESIDILILICRLQYITNNFDEALQYATKIVEAPGLKVSFLAQAQADLKQAAAALVADVAFRRWESSPSEERDRHLAALEAARDNLLKLVDDAENSVYVMKVNGKLAFARSEHRKALDYMDRYIRKAGANDPEVLVICAFCLDRVGEIGLAHERLTQALAFQPENYGWWLERASMEFRMSRFDDAAKSIAKLPPEMLSQEHVAPVVQLINARAQGTPVGAEEESELALITATKLADRGELETARATLLVALRSHPQNARILVGLSHIELSTGDLVQARQYAEQAIAADAANEQAQRMQAALKADDPIAAIQQLHQSILQDPAVRAGQLMSKLSALAGYQENVARRLDSERDTAAAAKARELSSRAAAQAKLSASELERLAPDSPQLIEFKFVVSLQNSDWPAAEQLVAKAKSLNLDSADGLTYRGRLEMTRGNARQAVQAFEQATERIPYSAAAWRMLAMANQTLGNTAQSARALEQAYRCNPSDVPSAKAYVELLVQRGEKHRALSIVRDARRLAPADTYLRDRWLQLEAEVGDRALAMRERRRAYQSQPDDRTNAILLASLLGDSEPARELLVDAQGAPLYAEQRWLRMPEPDRERILARTKADWLKECDQILDKLAAGSNRSNPRDELQLASVRANLLRLRGDWAGGERVLQQMIASVPQNERTAGMYLELSRYQARGNHFMEAIATAKEALPFQNPEQLEADRELAAMYMQWGANAEAFEHLQKIVAAAPDRQVRKQLIECTVRLKRFDEAERMVREMIAEAGEDAVVVLLSATILEGRGDALAAAGDSAGADRRYAEQRQALAKAETLDPLSPLPRLLLAQSLIKDFERTKPEDGPGRTHLLEDAMSALSRAESIRPGAVETSLLRVAVLKHRKDMQSAASELRRLLDRAPDNITARRELVQTQLEMADVQSAMATINDAIRINPSLAVWHEVRGDLCRRELSDPANALASFTTADDLSPSPGLLLKIADTTFAVEKPDCRALVRRISTRGPELDSNPVLREFYARGLMCIEQKEEAVEQVKLAYAQRKKAIQDGAAEPHEIVNWFNTLLFLFPSETQTVDAAAAEQFANDLMGDKPKAPEVRAMANVWIKTGSSGASRAVELQRRAIEMSGSDATPTLIAMHAELAAYQIVSQDYTSAVETYQKLLTMNPRHLEALNNLAYLLSEELQQPARAIPFAEKAAEVAPRNESVLDTLGWLHYRLGNNDKAVEYLNQSLAILPTVTTSLHLAQVADAMHNYDMAIRALEQAIRLRPEPQARQRIDALRDDIEKKRTSGR